MKVAKGCPVRTIIVENAQRLLKGQKDAVMTAVTSADQCYDGDAWKSAQGLAHGTSVGAVRHFGKHTSELGETIAVRSAETGEIVGRFQIVSIVLVETGKLDAQQISATGFTSHEDVLARVGQRRMWLMEMLPSPTSHVL